MYLDGTYNSIRMFTSNKPPYISNSNLKKKRKDIATNVLVISITNAQFIYFGNSGIQFLCFYNTINFGDDLSGLTEDLQKIFIDHQYKFEKYD